MSEAILCIGAVLILVSGLIIGIRLGYECRDAEWVEFNRNRWESIE